MSNYLNNIKAKDMLIESVVSNGFDLLSEYVNNRTKVTLKCSEGHIFDKRPLDFRRSPKCPKCSGKCTSYAKDNFIKLLNNEFYKLIGEYISSLTKTNIMCPEGHIFSMRPNNFNMGHRCPKCQGLCKEQSEQNFIDNLKYNNYTITGKYKNTMLSVNVVCPEGHKWSIRPNDFKGGQRCPHCQGSTGQRRLQDILSEHIKEDVIYNDRKILNGLELDVYYPESNIGIEYQGDYWHNLPEHIERDKRKRELCMERDIKLIEVWDSEFLDNSDKVVNNILKEFI